MERLPEPELMDGEEQARAYAGADFSEPHGNCIRMFQECFPLFEAGMVLDLGCGPGDITARFARAYPRAVIHGIDGAGAMLRCGRRLLESAPDAGDLKRRISFIQGKLPGAAPPLARYDAVISNSLLHHLRDPSVLWGAVRRYAAPGAHVFVVDLMRPATAAVAAGMVEKYCAAEPPVLKADFYHSLLAAYETGEVRSQLNAAGLGFLPVETVSDRHLLVAGTIPAGRL